MTFQNASKANVTAWVEAVRLPWAFDHFPKTRLILEHFSSIHKPTLLQPMNLTNSTP